MLNKALSFVLLWPLLVLGLQLNNPTTALSSQGNLTITWTGSAGDPATFDLILVNSGQQQTWPLSSRVELSAGSVGVTLPTLQTGDGYSIEATMPGNDNNMISQVGPFSVGEPPSSTDATISSITPPSSTSTTPDTPLVGGPPKTSPGFGHTVSASSTPPGQSTSQGQGSSSSSPSNQQTPPPRPFNGNGAVGKRASDNIFFLGLGLAILGLFN